MICRLFSWIFASYISSEIISFFPRSINAKVPSFFHIFPSYFLKSVRMGPSTSTAACLFISFRCLKLPVFSFGCESFHFPLNRFQSMLSLWQFEPRGKSWTVHNSRFHGGGRHWTILDFWLLRAWCSVSFKVRKFVRSSGSHWPLIGMQWITILFEGVFHLFFDGILAVFLMNAARFLHVVLNNRLWNGKMPYVMDVLASSVALLYFHAMILMSRKAIRKNLELIRYMVNSTLTDLAVRLGWMAWHALRKYCLLGVLLVIIEPHICSRSVLLLFLLLFERSDRLVSLK